MPDMVRVERMLAHLMVEEDVSALAVEQAVNSARRMQLGDSVALIGPENQEALSNSLMRAAFLRQEVERLATCQ